ncbi:type II secretion system protein GspC [Thermodesulfobacteriota bacterium]
MQRSLTILNLLLIAGAVYLGVSAFSKITAKDQDRSDLSGSVPGKASSLQTETRQPMSYYTVISGRNLFNTQPAAEIKDESIDIGALKKTDLRLKLWGTVTGDDTRVYAVIEETGTGEQNLYRVGDTVQQATVKMILREKVVINVEGKDEILEIAEVTADDAKKKRALGSFPRREKKTSGDKEERIRRRQASLNRPQRINLKSAQIKEMLEDTDELMRQIKMRPHFENGKPDGLTLSNIKPNSIFRKMGLRNGDVISKVDGEDIKTKNDAMQVFESLQSASTVKLQVKRRGRPKTIDYHIQ